MSLEIDPISREQFQALAIELDKNTSHSSSDHDRVKHPTCQQIIAMGEVGIALMLEDLRDNPNSERWFLPIYTALGYEPVSPLEEGNFDSTTRAYLAWGESAGLLDNQNTFK